MIERRNRKGGGGGGGGCEEGEGMGWTAYMYSVQGLWKEVAVIRYTSTYTHVIFTDATLYEHVAKEPAVFSCAVSVKSRGFSPSLAQ